MRIKAMRTITKILGTGAAIAAVGILGSYAFAQHGPGFGPGRMGMGPGMMMGKGHGTMGAMADPVAHLATLKAELGIKPEQQSAWDTYARVVIDTATAGRARREGMSPDTVSKMETKERAAFIAGMQQERQKRFEAVKAAAEVLLAVLDDAQKAKAGSTLPGLAEAGHGPGMRHGMMGAGKGMGPPWMR
jgi:hypothetical protein